MITGGKVTFTRSIQPAQFETKKAEVEIVFTMAEGASLEAGQAELNAAAEMAQSKALEMLGLKKATPVETATVTVDDKAEKAAKAAAEKEAKAAADKAAKAAAAELEKASKAATKTKADLEKEAVAKAGGGAAVTDSAAVVTDAAAVTEQNISVSPEDRKDPAAIEDDSLFAAEPVSVTDAELRSKIMLKNEKLKNPLAIRQLVGKYVNAGQSSNDIPADKRAGFLVELEAL